MKCSEVEHSKLSMPRKLEVRKAVERSSEGDGGQDDCEIVQKLTNVRDAIRFRVASFGFRKNRSGP
ncbi:hypothetical protein OUZ56_000221 [Daphnia magna]|uniref:Uncharacterized protein n=1 Tax=Daphnia magna TaxID=35525 RepID=A0ABQ9ZZ08_9CRUS|nr:hypothetical protein OUZ56_000221 [Daphnia magna]